MASIPVTILNGFLGSGKTTLLRSLLSQCQAINDVPAVIVNDMSELDVDGVLVANTEVVDEEQNNFVTISGDSISSQQGLEKLHAAMDSLNAEHSPSWIIIETSGSTHPMPLIRYFKSQASYQLKGVITLVDAIWMRDDYDCGRQLIPRWQTNMQQQQRGIENLLAEQILFSNQVILTKTDRIEAQQIQTIAEALHPINPHAAITAASWGKISAEQLKQMPEYNFFLVEGLMEELKAEIERPLQLSKNGDQALVAHVIQDDRPFHPMRLWHTCQNFLTQGVFRSKGFFWLPSRDELSLLWSQANGNIGLEVVGFWRVAAFSDPEQILTDDQVAVLQQKIDKIDSRFGDRRCRLTVIGKQSEVSQFVNALEQCFLSDAEILEWKNGHEFDDPWPQKVVQLNASMDALPS